MSEEIPASPRHYPEPTSAEYKAASVPDTVPRSIQQHPYVLEVERETFELIAQVIEILDTHDLWGPDDTYTWKDGTRWAKFDPTSHKK